MRKLLLLLMLAPAAYAQTYNVPFTATENPVSQGGAWVNGAAQGIDWGNAQTTSGHIFGTNTSPGCPSTPTACNDSTASLVGTWSASQQACAVVSIGAGLDRVSPNFYEVEIKLRQTITAHSITGYEFNYSMFNNGNQYMQIVRWNGALGNFTTLTTTQTPGGTPPVISSGDTFCASAIGSTLKSWVIHNGTQIVSTTATDSSIGTGTPGVGFFNKGAVGDNANFGFSSFSATSTNQVTAATCSAADVTSAWATVTASTTLFIIPAGTCDWSSGVTLTAPSGSTSITIQGAGNTTGSDSLGNPTGYNDQTNIAINSGTSGIVKFTSSSAQTLYRMTGMSFTFGSPGTSSCSISWSTNRTSPPIVSHLRFDHNHIVTAIDGLCLMQNFNAAIGVVDHNVIAQPVGVTHQTVTNFWRVGTGIASDGFALGGYTWNQPTQFGTDQFLYFENNFITGAYFNDCSSGGKQVFRYNTIVQANTQGHEGTGDFRSCRATEYYQNTVTCDVAHSMVGTRGGTMLVWGNTATSCTSETIGLNNSRTDGHTFGPPPDWFYCGTLGTIPGPSPWDGNLNTSGWPCVDQDGRGQGDYIYGSAFGFGEPMRANVTFKLCPTASTTGSGGAVTCPAGYTVASGTTVGTGTYPHQALYPIYEWLDSRQTTLAVAGDCFTCVQNRDWYGETLNQAAQTTPTSPFNGSTGTGHGTTGNRPTSCTAGPGGTFGGAEPSIGGSMGVGYWDTTVGKFYSCTATNTWTLVYTPLCHPHPLITGGTCGGGGPPVVVISPSSLSFGSVIVGQSSAIQTSTLSNTGGSTLTITSIVNSDTTNYTETNTCGSAVFAGGSCQISVKFNPASAGSKPATVSVTDNASGSPHTITLSGTGTTATANFAVAPPSLTFASQTVGTSSAPQTLTVTNSGSAALTITSILSQGTNAGDFAPTPTGCASVAPSGGTCTVSVVFTPAASGNRSSAIVFTDNAAGSPQSVPVSGVGAGSAAIGFNPASIAFPNTRVLVTSAALSTTVTNTGGATLTISAVALTGTNASMFAITANTCVTSLAPNATCNVSVTFTPSSSGAKTAALSFTDNAAGSPQSVPLSGTGTQSIASFFPTSLAFGSQQVSTTSAPLSTRLTNTGSVTLNISSIALTGTNAADFLVSSNTCGTTLAPSAFCDIGVTFTPQGTGVRNANLSFTDDAPGSPQTVPLSGTGTAPVVGFNPVSLLFGQVAFGSSAQLPITLTNNGGATLVVSGIIITGTNPSSFSQTNNCTSIAPSASCTINVTFTPQAATALSALVSVTDNAAGSPHTVPLSGTGTQGAVSLNPSTFSFGNQAVGTTSAAQSVTVKNIGTATFTFTSTTIVGNNPAYFAISANTCGATLAVNATCLVSVTFTPGTTGSFNANLQFVDTAQGSPHTVFMSGTGTGTPTVNFNPTSLTFPSTIVGQSSAPQAVTLQNTGTGPLTISSISLTGTNPGDYLQVNTCGASVAAGGSCTISITFNPTTSGTRTASISVTDNAAGSPHTVPISGTAITATANFSVLPTSLTFASQTVGTTSAPQTLTVTNSGSAALTITSIVSQGTNSGDFVPTPTGCASVAPSGGTCTVSVVFTPSSTGARSSAIVFTDNASGSPHSVPVSGTGTAAAVSFNPASLTFPNTAVGVTSSAMNTILQNTGTGLLLITSIGITGTNAADFAETNTCGSSVDVGGSCVISVKFTPGSTGSRTASVSVTDNASGSPHTVSLQGTGFTPSPTVSLSMASLTFGNQTVGTSSNPMVVILTNTGTSTLTISGTTITGTNAGDFGSSTTCGGTLAAGAACTYSFTFTPTGAGARSATFNLSTNAASSPDHVALAGTGVSSPNGAPAPQLFGF